MSKAKARLRFSAIAITPLIAGHAFAEQCNPRDFAASTYEVFNDYEKLSFLSSLSEGKFKELRAQHSGKMTIPYINVPASGDFSFFQQQINQVRTMLAITMNREAENTVIKSRLEAEGVEAYKACVRQRTAWISVSPSNLFTKQANLIVNWYDDRSMDVQLGNLKIINGKIIGDFVSKMGRGESSVVQIERADLSEPTTVSLTVGGIPAEISLPAKPSYRLEYSAIKFPDSRVEAGSAHANAYPNQEIRGSAMAPNNSQFLLGSATIIDSVFDNGGACRAENTAMAASIICNAAAPRKGVGVGAKSYGVVTVLKSVKIE